MRELAKPCRNPENRGCTDDSALRSKWVSIIGLAALIGALEARGLSKDALLRDTGIDPDALQDPHATVSATQEFALVQNLLDQLSHPAPGLFAGTHYHLSALGLVGTALSTTPTPAAAIRFFLRYVDFSYTYFAVTYEEGQDGPCIYLADRYDLGGLRRYFLDRDTTFIRTAARDLLPQQSDEALVGVEFAYPPPSDLGPYRSSFPCPVSFGATITRVRLNPALITLPLPQANALTLRLLEQQCRLEALECGSQSTWTERIRAMLVSRVSQFAHMTAVAKRLGCTSRTVARHLRAEGTHFQQLLDEARTSVARHLLAYTDLSVEAIASEVGYCEASAFIAAFRRWTGGTPSAYRKQVRDGGH
jgi:AraC-like DNA-binding protein